MIWFYHILLKFAGNTQLFSSVICRPVALCLECNAKLIGFALHSKHKPFLNADKDYNWIAKNYYGTVSVSYPLADIGMREAFCSRKITNKQLPGVGRLSQMLTVLVLSSHFIGQRLFCKGQRFLVFFKTLLQFLTCNAALYSSSVALAKIL